MTPQKQLGVDAKTPGTDFDGTEVGRWSFEEGRYQING